MPDAAQAASSRSAKRFKSSVLSREFEQREVLKASTRVLVSERCHLVASQKGDYCVFQNDGMNRTRIANSSSRPASIRSDSSSLLCGAKSEKFIVGQTAPRPGPMLFNVAATALAQSISSMLCPSVWPHGPPGSIATSSMKLDTNISNIKLK